MEKKREVVYEKNIRYAIGNEFTFNCLWIKRA